MSLSTCGLSDGVEVDRLRSKLKSHFSDFKCIGSYHIGLLIVGFSLVFCVLLHIAG